MAPSFTSLGGKLPANHEVSMRKNLATLFAAASLAVAGMGIAGCQNKDEPEMTGSTRPGTGYRTEPGRDTRPERCG